MPEETKAETIVVEPLVTTIGEDGQVAWYQSVVVTRIDSGIHDPAALRGTVIGLVDPQSTSGYVMPRAVLREAGLDPDRDLTIRLLGTHKAVVEAVIAGDVAAGVVHINEARPPTPDHGRDYARLRILASSRPIPRGKSPTLKSIAALAGVSYGTVSRVVNGSTYVAPATAARVSAIVKELGYRPSSYGVSLRKRPTPSVGLVIPLNLDRPLRSVTEPLRAELATAGVPLVLCPVDGPIGESPYLDMLLDERLGALVVLAPEAADPALTDAARAGRIVVAIDGRGPGMVATTLDRAATALLIALGLAPGRASGPVDGPTSEAQAPARTS